MEHTIAAIATPLAAGAVGILRVSGPQATEIGDRVFRPIKRIGGLSSMKGYTAVLGRVFDVQGEIDEAIATVFKAPKSYTGEEVVEFSCHGGPAILERLLSAVITAGAHPAEPGEFTKRAFLNGKLSLTQAEAVAELISSGSQSYLSCALAAKDGKLFSKINAIKTALVGLQGSLSAAIDFPEEDIEELSMEDVVRQLGTAHTQLSELLTTFEVGSLIRNGIYTVIAGKPNVGKSSIMNLLCRTRVSIVTEIAGTTRDVVEAQVRLGNLCLRLADTAGIRSAQDTVEAEGIRIAREKLEQAQLVLCIFDGAQPLSDEDRELLSLVAGKRVIAVINKSDLPQKIDSEEVRRFAGEPLVLSTREEEAALSALHHRIAELVGIAALQADTAVLVNERQRSAAEKAKAAVEIAVTEAKSGIPYDLLSLTIESAIQALMELTGEKVSDAIVDEVFSKFCVGK